MIQLTKNFTLKEFELGHTLDPSEVQKAFLFAIFILQPVRDRFGPTAVTNFKRTKEDFVRLISEGYEPSPTSQHFTCEAVDFKVFNTNLREVYNFICTEIDWPGEIELDLKKEHLHVGWPRFGLKPDRFIKEKVLTA